MNEGEKRQHHQVAVSKLHSHARHMQQKEFHSKGSDQHRKHFYIFSQSLRTFIKVDL